MTAPCTLAHDCCKPGDDVEHQRGGLDFHPSRFFCAKQTTQARNERARTSREQGAGIARFSLAIFIMNSKARVMDSLARRAGIGILKRCDGTEVESAKVNAAEFRVVQTIKDILFETLR